MMMALEKELTQDQILGVERLSWIKQGLPAEKWKILRLMMLAYASGMEAGMVMERAERNGEAV